MHSGHDQIQTRADAAAKARARRRVRTVKHLLVFQIKLLLEGIKDVVLGPLSLAAAALDVLSATEAPNRHLDTIMRLGERYENWLGLYRIGDLPEADELSQALEVSQVHPPPHPPQQPPQIEATRVDSGPP